MKLNLTEQESLDNVKYFLRDYGKYVGLFIVALIVFYLVDTTWNWYQGKISHKSAALYQEVVQAFANKDSTTVFNVTNQLEAKYPHAEYTTMSSMLAAKLAQSASNNKLSETYLQFAIRNSKDQGLINIARLRLADIYIDTQQYAKVIPLLSATHDKSFDALYYSKRGDLHVAQGKLDQAIDSYKSALQKAGDDQTLAQYIQMRLDVLGGNSN